MAFPSTVNGQITDSVTQAHTKVVGDVPAVAMSNLFQATSQALSNAAHNATTAQQQANITAQAAATMGVSTLYSIDTASTGVETQDIFRRQMLKSESKGYVVNSDTIIGHIHSKIYSPLGKQKVIEAVQQAHESPKIDAPTDVMKKAQSEIEKAIAQGKADGISNQSIGYTLNQVAEDKGINLLYPALSAPDLTAEQVEAYYTAIIAAK